MSAGGGAQGGGALATWGRVILVCGVIVVGAMGAISIPSLGVVLVEGPLAVGILLAGLGLGVEVLRFLQFRAARTDGDLARSGNNSDSRPHPGPPLLKGRECAASTVRGSFASYATRLVIACGFGLGALSLVMLLAGLMGWMNRGAWIGVAAVLATRGLVEVWRAGRRKLSEPAQGGWVLVAIAPFVAAALLAASFPPGILWPAEGNGYDVLEYHLGAVRDFLDAGRITYLPHNTYSNFPFGVEMLYLLGMILRGDPLKAAFTAQLLHAMLGMLAGVAVWCAARAALRDANSSRRNAAHVAGLIAVSCPMVLYVGALAYTENGLVLYTALALWAVFEGGKKDQIRPMRWFALAGSLAGFAFGCKYIAVPQVVLPLAIGALWAGRRAGAARALVVYGVGAAVTMSPWLIRNAVNTGNPVFPLARTVFAEKAGIWNDDGAARWEEGHLPAPEHRSVGGRMERLWNQVLWNPLFGPVMGLGILSALIWLVRRNGDANAICVILLVGSLVTWLCFTHLVDRFAMAALVPASILVAAVIGAAIPAMPRPLFAMVVVAANLLLFVFTTFDMLKLVTARDSVGIKWFTEGEWPTHQHVPTLNEIVRGGGRVLMVADARRFYLDHGVDYCVVFNRNPFAEAAERMSAGELIAWLREQGYTHVFVNWSEMARLRGSRYGFWKSVDAELFKRMMNAGLTVAGQFAFDQERAPYGTLFTVGR